MTRIIHTNNEIPSNDGLIFRKEESFVHNETKLTVIVKSSVDPLIALREDMPMYACMQLFSETPEGKIKEEYHEFYGVIISQEQAAEAINNVKTKTDLYLNHGKEKHNQTKR